jgi:hypothetical protein
LLLTMKLMNQGFLLIKLKSSFWKFYCLYHELIDDGYVPLVVAISRFFPHSWLITDFVTRLTRRVPLVEEELLTLSKHLSSPALLVGFVLLDL